MKKILPIIIAVVITAVASSGITYYVTVEMLDKNESSFHKIYVQKPYFRNCN